MWFSPNHAEQIMFIYVRDDTYTEIKFPNDKLLSNLFVTIRAQMTPSYNRKYALTNKLIAKIAINGLMINSEAHFLSLVDKYQERLSTVKLIEPQINRVRITGTEKHILNKLKADLLIEYNISIKVPALFKLSMMALSQVDQKGINTLLDMLEIAKQQQYTENT